MSNKLSLVQKVKKLLLSDDEKALTKAGVTYSNGNLTLEGRKLVLNYLFESNEEVRNAVVSIAKQLVEEECKKKKG